MFSQHPFTLEHRYSVETLPALPAWKRALDVVVSIAALPLLAFLTFVFTLIGTTWSRGPVFYREVRSGFMGRTLRIYRFRTMDTARPDDAGPDGASARRLIPGGRLLRATGLVALPQVLNVLRGEMSLVGPRPGLPLARGERGELLTVPGITGLWRFKVGPMGIEEARGWEKQYLEKRSLRTDVWLLFRTLLTIIFLSRTH